MNEVKRYAFFISVLLLAGCLSNNKKTTIPTGVISVYKVWQFKNVDTASTPGHKNAAWIGENLLDLTNKDTLRFSYGSTHNKPTAYPYKIQHDTIFIQNKPGYKIIKLTANELDLMAVFNNHLKAASKDSIVMIYTTK